ncbi:Pimeloyl-ACP methyl ester carboxylesterase [Noviherbaspirillum humi]|uniref:Pimeloyl-ACP methyl ester carboxylesterase n=2 Tax=Noviherbaspirillum humi TaxID=1688639 RepID=A0A239F3E9_9BURK|nr:Pimeloyl-ACP methyl ester carboxylesterase [Noviherbaspirillum humi]
MTSSTRQLDQAAPDEARAPALRGKSMPVIAGLLATLAASAAFVRYKTNQVEKQNPPAGKFVEVNGVRLHYVERGEGQALVLLHGNGTSSQEVDSSGLIDVASASHRVLAFDRPGYGYSERPGRMKWNAEAQADLLHEALQRLGVEKPIIVAHSWATMVAIAFALRHPGAARSLVLLSGYYYPTPRMDVAAFSPTALPVVGDAMRHTVSPLIGRAMWPAFLAKLFAPTAAPQRFLSEYPVWMSLRPGQLRATTEEIAMMIPSAAELSARYGELKLPVVIMAGKSDLHVLPRLHSERLHAAIPHSKLVLVSGVGHMVTHSALPEVMQAIRTADGDSHAMASQGVPAAPASAGSAAAG